MNKKFFLGLLGIFLIILSLNMVLGLTGSVSPSKYILSGEIGETFNRSLWIKNTNDVPVTVTLSSSSGNIDISNTEILLAADESKYVPISIELVTIGTVNENIRIVFSDGVNEFIMNTGVTLIADPATNSDVSIDSLISPETPEAIAGEELIVLAQLTNTGDIETDYVVSIHGHSSFSRLNLIENDEITLIPGASETVIIHLNVLNTATGSEDFIIQVDYSDKRKEATVNLDVIQRGVVDIGFIVKYSNNPDSKLVSLIEEMGYTYQIIDDSQIPETDFRLYKMILVGDERIRDIPIDFYRSLVINPDYYGSFSSSKGSSTKSNLYLRDDDITIASGIATDFYAYSSPSKTLNYLTGQKYSRSIVTAGSSVADQGKFVLAVKENPRRVFFGATEVDYWSQDSEELFKNSLYWVINGEDKDNDGYYSDVDCNDNDAGLYNNVLGYVDFDRDGFGGGNIFDVCIGNSGMVEGFSYVGGDCNDDAFIINPDAEEIPRNGIDDNCNGYDNSDVDGDGFDSVEVGGTDCNDDESSVFQILFGYLDIDNDDFGKGDPVNVCAGNFLPRGYSDNSLDCNNNNQNVYPGAVELLDSIDQNCVNDAPVKISDVRDISWYEDSMYPGVLDLKEYIKDPDGDTLTFDVYSLDNVDIVVDINNGLVEFSSINDFNGESIIIFSGTDDGLKNVNTNEIKLVIDPENDGPEIINIDDFKINLEEDFGTYEFDLTLFMNDLDDEIEDLHWTIEYSNGEFLYSLEENTLTLTSIEDKYCSSLEDDCSIMLRLIDPLSNLDRKLLMIDINPINDAPSFNGEIVEIEWDEDEELIDHIDLNDYFNDVDLDSLDFSVSGNTEIIISISDLGIVSFSTPFNWFGSETIIFLAEDFEYIVNSNEIILSVFDKEEPPIFGEMDCLIDVMEEEENNCLLVASNLEDDSMSYSIVNEDNLECEIDLLEIEEVEFDDEEEINEEGDEEEENYVKYKSYEDYFGEASCTVRVTDKDGYDEYVLTVDVENINDAPKILTIDPTGDRVRVLDGNSQLFTFFSNDFDSSEIFVKWYLNSVEIEESEINEDSSYEFDEDLGTYELKVRVSDDFLSNENVWEVFVGTINDFSCSEVSGNICSADQICSNGDYLDVFDTQDCCSVSCTKRPPEFKRIKRKSDTKTSDIYLEIRDIDSSENYYLGDKIPVDIRIENNDYDNDLDMEIHTYLYDLTREDIISSEKIEVKIDKRSLRTQRFDLDVTTDIRENNDFAIFVYAYSEENDRVYYNEKYVLIDLSRRLHDVEIDNVEIEPIRAVCGDPIFYKIKLNNIGESDETVKLNIESPSLSISKTINDIDIDSYSTDDDSESLDYIFRLPEKVGAGEYTIRTKITYNNGGDYKRDESVIVLEECKNQDVEVVVVENDPITISNVPYVEEKENKIGSYIVYGIALVFTLITFAVLIVTYRNFEKLRLDGLKNNGKSKKVGVKKVSKRKK
ncbi:hypothetical protein GOV12_07670 [Candidatus Pacearchaeota archaeon]|nr:hypothetical protein [Candidatus Pacearchaeota archaeon]